MRTLRRKLLLLVLFLLMLCAWLYFGAVLLSTTGGIEELFTPLPTIPNYTQGLDFTKPVPQPLSQPSPTIKLKQTAWIPDWDMTDGLKALAQAASTFDSVSPVWYYVNDKGLIDSKQNKLAETLAITTPSHIKLIPSIADFSADHMHIILGDSQKLQAHVDYLISEVEKYNYDGLDLDYESIYLDDQSAYLSLVRKLYEYLDGKGKKLTVAVMPQWSHREIYATLLQTRAVQDWTEMIPIVHELRIMAYNYTDYTSTFSGPIAPLDWAEAVLREARADVKLDKVVLGVSLYGYDGWSNNLVQPSPYLGQLANPPSGKGQADAVTYQDVLKSKATAVSDALEPISGEKVLQYKLKDKQYLVYYQDGESVALRKQLANSFNIGGLAFWRMGGEDVNAYL